MNFHTPSAEALERLAKYREIMGDSDHYCAYFRLTDADEQATTWAIAGHLYEVFVTHEGWPRGEYLQALDAVIKSRRPLTRSRVEKARPA